MGRSKRIALLIDVDNVKISKSAIDELLDILNNDGEVVYCKFYGYNDRKHIYLSDFINHYGYETAPFMRLKKRYSQLDNRMIVDAVKMNYTKPDINAFCIVAGNGDLIPLLVELKSNGKTVIDINSEYQDLNAHMFDQHIYLRNIDKEAESYEPKAKKDAPKKAKKATTKKAEKAEKVEPVKSTGKIKPIFADDYDEEKVVVKPVERPASKPAKKVEVEEKVEIKYENKDKTEVIKRSASENLNDYIEDELYNEPKAEFDLSELLKDITSRYNELDFTTSENMNEKLKLIRDIEKIIEKENAKGEGIYSDNEDIRQIFTDLQEVVDDMKNAL